MMSRNWLKDWEMCEMATQGPWKACGAKDGCGLVWSMHTDSIVATTNTDEAQGIKSGIKRKLDDAEFIAEAREALPYWLQRVRELETALEIMEKQLEIAAREITNINPEYDTCPAEYDGELTCTCNGTIIDVYRCWLERWKQKALAAFGLIDGGSRTHSGLGISERQNKL